MEKTVILNAIIAVGQKEVATSEIVKNAVGVLTENNILTEIGLYDWAVSTGYWNTAWPKPRSIWQEISRQTLSGGKKVKWEVRTTKKLFISKKIVIFFWKDEGLEIQQELDLPVVAGLGRLCARLAVAQSRERKGDETGKGKGDETGKGKGDETGKGKGGETMAAEAAKAKEEAAKAKEEAAKAKEELLAFKRDVETGLLEEKAVKAAKKDRDAAFAALEEIKAASSKMREERDKKEETLLSIANTLQKASIDAPKEELWAILQEIKDALNGKPISVTRREMP